MLTRKRNAIKDKKSAGFSELPAITKAENIDDDLISRKIIEESKLNIASIKL